MTSLAARVLAEEAASHGLPMPAWAFAVMALAIFALLLAFTWAFRGNAQKHTPDSQRTDHHSTELAHAHGGTMHDQRTEH
jgi:protein-S-isoprenylcysteine O-methyltransferase Ste14